MIPPCRVALCLPFETNCWAAAALRHVFESVTWNVTASYLLFATRDFLRLSRILFSPPLTTTQLLVLAVRPDVRRPHEEDSLLTRRLGFRLGHHPSTLCPIPLALICCFIPRAAR